MLYVIIVILLVGCITLGVLFSESAKDCEDFKSVAEEYRSYSRSLEIDLTKLEIEYYSQKEILETFSAKQIETAKNKVRKQKEKAQKELVKRVDIMIKKITPKKNKVNKKSK